MKGCYRIHILAGETRTVKFTLNGDSFAHWSDEEAGMTIHPGDVEILIGRSPGDIELTETLEITA